MKKIKKYIDYALVQLKRKLNEKKYNSQDATLKYLFYQCENSDKMVVVFSACTRVGIPARYNYVRTLDGENINRLYILDDEGTDKRGSFYLGSYPEYKTEKAVLGLINTIIDKYNICDLYFAGSSKGGWAALNIAASMDRTVKAIVIGAPQYYLGNYLKAPANVTSFDFVKGSGKEEDVVEELNNHLKNKIKSISNTEIFLHYSEYEHTYNDHIISLLEDLKKFSVVINEDKKEYTNHQDVSLYFPQYLKDTIALLINREAEHNVSK